MKQKAKKTAAAGDVEVAQKDEDVEPAGPGLFERLDLWIAAGLSVLVLAIYAQTFGFDYINFDDTKVVSDNPMVLAGLTSESVAWAWRSFETGNWNPVTWMSLQLDIQLFGNNPGRLHLVNTLLHLANSVLAFYVFRRMTDAVWPSALVAALFAVHPTHVESVAWIAERRDVLSTLFWMLTMWSYARWCQSGAKAGDKFYLAAIAFFAVGLMVKPMLVTLPFVLLLCDIWPLGRARLTGIKANARLITEKIPFFALTVASSVVTYVAQSSAGAVQSLERLPLLTRVENSVLSYAKYISMLFYPAGLAVWYPLETELAMWQVAVSAVILIAITAACVWQFREHKYLLIGWLWYVGTLFPVSGLFQAGGQALADRYTYVPYFGLFIMLAWGMAELVERVKLPAIVPAVGAGAAVVALTFAAYSQTAYWADSETLFRRTLDLTKGNYLIGNNYCDTLVTKGRFAEAEAICRQAMEANPRYAVTYNTLGMALFRQNRYAEAEQYFQRSVEMTPRDGLMFANLASAQMFQGKADEAEPNLQKAVALSAGKTPPATFAPILQQLAATFASQQNYQKAYDNMARVVYLKPNDGEARMRLGVLALKLGRLDEAQATFEPLARSAPNNAAVLNLYGQVLLEKKQYEQAAAQFEAALRIQPNLEEAKTNLAKARGGK
jgi:protein O-mannosyl-transferase